MLADASLVFTHLIINNNKIYITKTFEEAAAAMALLTCYSAEGIKQEGVASWTAAAIADSTATAKEGTYIAEVASCKP